MVPVQTKDLSPGKLSSHPDGFRRSEWSGGAFETAYRPRTAHVSGEISSHRHLVMVTLRGGARQHVYANADGQRHEGPDLTGSVSFLPAGCERRLALHDVEWRWAAIALDALPGKATASLARTPSLALKHEPFIFGLLQEMERLDALSGGMEPIYAETMAGALVQYMVMRFGDWQAPDQEYALPPFKLRRVRDFVAANLGARVSLGQLAALCDLSERHFHRAFKVTTRQTPLDYIVEKRMERARLLLSSPGVSIAAVSLEVGFANPGHFARAFAAATGMTPSAYRNRTCVN